MSFKTSIGEIVPDMQIKDNEQTDQQQSAPDTQSSTKASEDVTGSSITCNPFLSMFNFLPNHSAFIFIGCLAINDT